MKTPRSSLALLIAALVLHGTAGAESLYGIYQRAQESDPTLRAAAAARDVLLMLALSTSLGWLGAFFAVGQTLRITLGLRDELVQITGSVAHSEPNAAALFHAGSAFSVFPPRIAPPTGSTWRRCAG